MPGAVSGTRNTAVNKIVPASDLWDLHSPLVQTDVFPWIRRAGAMDVLAATT